MGTAEEMAHTTLRPTDLGDGETGRDQHLRQLAGKVGPHVVPAVEEAADGEQHPGDALGRCAEVNQQEPTVWCTQSGDFQGRTLGL